MAETTSAFEQVASDGSRCDIERAVAREVPIAVEPGGVGYAVLMASDEDLEDLAYGFAWAERLVGRPDQIEHLALHRTEQGVVMRIGLAFEVLERVHERVRHRTSESSCGLCGIENLEQALRPLPRLPDPPAADERAIFAALAALRDHQPLNRATGGVHAAALCAADGTIRLVREDVGRHNAFDKLIGAMLRGGLDWDGGFALLSSRCSFELVEKAVLAGCPRLVTISVPTELSLRRAREANLDLYVLARGDSVLHAL
ncbi:formate dehydrogenase accessory sulfurtransferase FdhD [Novosphingobium sp. YJ-S2-02]|uniref:Sulfur carrier protein FdhD n=1 Tax=Novosphingobium aureum TaxID=2792964 RepID=A0A931MK45_9SPHN|nr:formate dehydrogenase accessory sulfurtransferase FdhD [Novosphingobium aureum]MBH0112074.1 formate dehydrogenase accessory sulfurtransferase FdhD [Novosphingobium aureum]